MRLRKVSRFRKHQPGIGQQPRQRAVERRERPRMAAHEVREDRNGREDAVAADQRESGAASQLEVFAGRAIARDACTPTRSGSGVRAAGTGCATAGAPGSAPRPAARRRAAARGRARPARAAAPRTRRCSSTSRHSARSNERVGERQRRDRAVRDARGRVVGVDARDVEAVRRIPRPARLRRTRRRARARSRGSAFR